MIKSVTRGLWVGIAVRGGAATCIVGLAAASLAGWALAGQSGSGVGIDYQIVGMTVGKTALGGSELVAITRRVRAQ